MKSGWTNGGSVSRVCELAELWMRIDSHSAERTAEHLVSVASVRVRWMFW